MGRIRVLHCPGIVAGHAPALARAEREVGLDSWAVALRLSPYGYESDEIASRTGDHELIVEFKRWRLFLRALRDFDIVHFNFGQSLMPNGMPTSGISWRKSSSVLRHVRRLYARVFELRDLPLLKKCGKGIVVTYQGDDARQGDFCRMRFGLHHVNEVEPGYYSPQSDAHKRRRIERFARYADRIFALNPDLLYVLPPQAEFLPYCHVDTRDWRPVESHALDSRPRIVVHAPTHRAIKGTRFVQGAVARLKMEGVPVEFRLIEGVQHTEARRMLQQADLVVDQLLVGWYGGIAVEAMALAKPVVCYIREDDLKFIPEQMRKDLPLINATPKTLHDVLKEWLTSRRDELPEVGCRSRAYVEAWHDPLRIAAKAKREYERIMASRR